MKHFTKSLSLGIALLVSACSTEKNENTDMRPEAPIAAKADTLLSEHGQSRLDPYFWMRDDDRKDEAVLSQLRKENAHTKAATTHLDAFKDELYQELKSHVKETDVTAPYPKVSV